MSAISGIYSFDGRKVNLELLSRLTEAGSIRAGGPRNTYSDAAGVGLGHCQFRTTEESFREKQPYSNHSKDLWITFDGRVDNRNTLIKELSNYNMTLHDPTDVEIVINSYEIWGAGCVQRIVGDYAFVVWDAKRKRLFCARDFLGVRPLYYYCDERIFLWASTIKQLFCYPKVRKCFSEDYLANFLVLGPHVGEASPFQGIYRLLPGYYLVIENQHITKTKYWDLDPQNEVRLTDDHEYEHQLLVLLMEAVKSRLRCQTPVWAQLSGGLDSSSIVCMAHEILRRDLTHHQKFVTLTTVYDQAPESDERKFSQSVSNKCGFEAHYINSKAFWPFKNVLDDRIYIDEPTPELFYSAQIRQAKNLLEQNRARVLLCGAAGDQLFQSCPDNLAFLFKYLLAFDFKTLTEEIRAWAKYLRTSYFKILVDSFFHGLLPCRFKTHIRDDWEKLPTWIEKSFAKRMNLEERMWWRKSRHCQGIPFWKKEQYLQIKESIPTQIYRGHLDMNLEVRYPFIHRPLVEFAFAIPFDQTLRSGETRSIQRRTMRGILPETVRKRIDKRGPDQAFFLGLRKEWASLEPLFSSTLLVELRMVSGSAWQETSELARQGFCSNLPGFYNTLSLELWLNAILRS